MTKALLKGEGAISLSGIVKRFSGKTSKAFVATSNAEYAGYNSYLEGVIFGW